MIFLYGTVFLWYLILFILSHEKKQVCGEIGKERSVEGDVGHEMKNGMLEDMAVTIYKIGIKAKIFRQKNAKENLLILHPEMGGKEEREDNYLRKFYVKKIRLLILIVFIGNMLATCLWFSSRMGSAMTEGKYIKRNAYGMGNREVNLQVEIEDEQKERRQDLVITVEEQKYEDALIKEMAKEIPVILPDIIRGSNITVDEVRSDLNLVHNIEGYPFQIAWESDNYARVYPDGSVMNEEAEGEGEIVNLTAVITYGGYKEEHIFPVCVFPPDYSEDELWKKKVYEALMGQEEKDRCKDRVELPDSIEGSRLVWSEKADDSSGYLFLLICISAGAVYLLQEKTLNEKIEERNRQMLLDYPQLISKLMLYMGAGMTIRNAFQKIAFHYSKEKQEGGGCRYVYEEMLLACHELDSGISEASVYERFGKRCRLPQYTKLSNILVQNLRKGSNGMLDALRQEAKNAFEERKNTARRLGEEAGTKLLLPMMLMLGIVMILIIIPAYFSFSL